MRSGLLEIDDKVYNLTKTINEQTLYMKEMTGAYNQLLDFLKIDHFGSAEKNQLNKLSNDMDEVLKLLRAQVARDSVSPAVVASPKVVTDLEATTTGEKNVEVPSAAGVEKASTLGEMPPPLISITQ